MRCNCHYNFCCLGDGGNDVSMIQAADAGIGIEGKVSKYNMYPFLHAKQVFLMENCHVSIKQEGKQASLASDFSITQFKHIGRLLVWHGRNRFDHMSK